MPKVPKAVERVTPGKLETYENPQIAASQMGSSGAIITKYADTVPRTAGESQEVQDPVALRAVTAQPDPASTAIRRTMSLATVQG